VRRPAHEIGDADWLRESEAKDEAAGRDPLVTHKMEIIDHQSRGRASPWTPWASSPATPDRSPTATSCTEATKQLITHFS
jgi:hypothetical protein